MSNGNMRAQLSLLFTDKNLYENFIVPCKNDRRLHSIIMKCLSAYYYNDNVRNLIEGAELHSDEEVTEKINSHQDSINNIRDLLAMQGFISKELGNTMEDGIDDMSEMLDKVNKTAEDFGVVKTSETEYAGKSMKLLGVNDSKENIQRNNISKDNSAINNDNLIKMVTQMYTMFSQQDSFKQMFGNDMVELNNSTKKDKVNNSVEPSTENDDDVKTESEPITTDIGDLDVTDFEISPPPKVDEPELEEDELNLGEASGALGDLMASLYA